MHSWRRKKEPADERDRDGREDEDSEDVDRPREKRAAGTWKVEAEDAFDEQIEGTDGDDDESPEDEGVCESSYVVRALEELALSEIHDDLVTESPPGMVEARFVTPQSHVAVKAPSAPDESAETEERRRQ